MGALQLDKAGQVAQARRNGAGELVPEERPAQRGRRVSHQKKSDHTPAAGRRAYSVVRFVRLEMESGMEPVSPFSFKFLGKGGVGARAKH